MLTKNNRTTINRSPISKNEAIFRCPLCSNPLKLLNFRSLICSNRHCFDLSKRGYVNLLSSSNSNQTKYDKTLFQSRKMMNTNGSFEPLMIEIYDKMLMDLKWNNEVIKILDAGCDEGSLLSNIQQKLNEQAKRESLGVGIDIAKEGIQLAAKGNSNTIWCVADLADCPFADKQFNYILNILSPSNYSEFQRMLADDGMVIKVVPDSKYLQELRGVFYKQTNRNVYSNKDTLELFCHHFELVYTKRVQYSVVLDQVNLEHLIHMTPLSWGVSEELIAEVTNKQQTEITFDFSILCGKKK